MCTFFYQNTWKVIQNVCKRNLHTVIQGHILKLCSLSIQDKSSVFSNVVKPKVFYYNDHARYCFVDANIKSDIKNGNEQDQKNSTELYKNVEYNNIVGDDEGLLRKLKILMLEVEVMIQEGLNVPSKLKTSEWKELLLLETRTARRKYLRFLFLNEMCRLNEEKKKANKQIKIKERRAEEIARNDNNHIRYGFQGSTIFLRIYSTTIDNFYNSRLIQAMQFGQNLIVDCSYDSYMTPMESRNCAKQLMLLFAANRIHDQPYNLHFCNADSNSRVIQHLLKFIPTMYESSFPLNVTEKSYLDIFPRDKLVYLTPHCRNELTTFNHDDIYIIGAMVDKANSEPISLGKAKAEKIRMACLPLDKYLLWQMGSKSLTLNQVLNIMLDIQKSGSWTQALSHVPKRKLTDYRSKQVNEPLKRIWEGLDLKR